MKQKRHLLSWMNPKLEVRETGRFGLGVFTREDIARREMLFVCGGAILTLEDEDNLPPECADKPIEISEWFSIGPRTSDEIPLMPQHYVNHSCDPNAGWNAQLFLVAIRDIRAGEEVCYDYAMVMHSNPESASFWTIECQCGSPLCRNVVAEDDWLRTDLQARYNGYFAWHLQRKLNAVNMTAAGGSRMIISSGHQSGWHWMDDRVIAGESRFGGQGIFAAAFIPARSMVVVLGGRVMGINEDSVDSAHQIADDFVIGPSAEELADADRINHCCEPNLGFYDQLSLVTLRDVPPGEALCFDYATCVGGEMPYAMTCRCGAKSCRGTITHEDWKLLALQRRYDGFFQWYLQEKIKSLNRGQKEL